MCHYDVVSKALKGNDVNHLEFLAKEVSSCITKRTAESKTEKSKVPIELLLREDTLNLQRINNRIQQLKNN